MLKGIILTTPADSGTENSLRPKGFVPSVYSKSCFQTAGPRCKARGRYSAPVVADLSPSKIGRKPFQGNNLFRYIGCVQAGSCQAREITTTRALNSLSSREGEVISHPNFEQRHREQHAAPADKESSVEKSFCVVNFYHLAEVDKPQLVVAEHRHWLQQRDILGRIYISHQGINAQLSGPRADAHAYAEWISSQSAFKVCNLHIADPSVETLTV